MLRGGANHGFRPQSAVRSAELDPPTGLDPPWIRAVLALRRSGALAARPAISPAAACGSEAGAPIRPSSIRWTSVTRRAGLGHRKPSSRPNQVRRRPHDDSLLSSGPQASHQYRQSCGCRESVWSLKIRTLHVFQGLANGVVAGGEHEARVTSMLSSPAI